jgi:branched-chain amino acid aminotransferase
MKAYKDASGALRLFRPEMNLERLNASAQRIALPGFDVQEMLKCVARFVDVDGAWVYG